MENLVELDERRDSVRRKVAAVKRSGEVSWKRHRRAAERAMTALVAGMADAKERLESHLLNA